MDPRLNLIITAQDQASRALGNARRSTGDLRSELGKLKGPALAAGAALTALAISSVQAASDLEESVNAVNVIFGDASNRILSFGEDAAQAVGLSNASFNQLATNTGALLTNFGQSQEQAAQTTLLLTNRAADLASVFNTEVDVALDAINAALRGETEAIRRFGADVTDATLQNYLLAQGIDATVQSMSQAEKANLRLSVLLEQTAAVQGDFAATADSLANTQRRLNAEWENARAELGQNLIPTLTDSLNAINNVVSGERGLLEQSLDDGLIGWLVRIGDENRWRDALDEAAQRVNELSDSDERWATTIAQVANLNAAAAKSARLRISADDDLVNVQISLLEVEQTRLKILDNLNAAVAAHNAAQREQADALAQTRDRTVSSAEAATDFGLSIAEVNRLGIEQSSVYERVSFAADHFGNDSLVPLNFQMQIQEEVSYKASLANTVLEETYEAAGVSARLAGDSIDDTTEAMAHAEGQARALARAMDQARRAQERLAGQRASARASTAAQAVDARINAAIARGELSEFDAATLRVNVRNALEGFSLEQQRAVFEGRSDDILFGRGTPGGEVTLVVGNERLQAAIYQGSQEYADVNGV